MWKIIKTSYLKCFCAGSCDGLFNVLEGLCMCVHGAGPDQEVEEGSQAPEAETLP